MIGLNIEGKYQLTAKLGEGGMGTVYRTRRLLIGDEVAVKILHAEYVAQPESLERFRREAQAAARLKHPNAVSIYDFGVTSDGLVYLVMELVEGKSLRQIIKHQSPLTPIQTAEIITQVCEAVQEAHRQQIVHRDLKPDNIVVNQGPTGVRTKVLDFGIAKLRDLSSMHLTQTGSVMGTPHYMSPEQCLGDEVDHRADIYSLGIVLYEMLAGVVPFNSSTPTAVIVKHVNQAPPSLRTINAKISPALERVVLQALAKRREERQQTASELANEFSSALEETAIASDFSQRNKESTVNVKARADRFHNSSTAIAPVQTDSRHRVRGALITIAAVVFLAGALISLIAFTQMKGAGSAASESSNSTAQSVRPTTRANAITEDEVQQLLLSWETAWETQNLSAYADFYEEKFIGRNYSSRSGYTSMTREQWLKDKERKFRLSPVLSVTIGQPTIQFSDAGATVQFFQEFRSRGYSDKGLKTLQLRKTSTGLKIVGEDFVPSARASL